MTILIVFESPEAVGCRRRRGPMSGGGGRRKLLSAKGRRGHSTVVQGRRIPVGPGTQFVVHLHRVPTPVPGTRGHCERGDRQTATVSCGRRRQVRIRMQTLVRAQNG